MAELTSLALLVYEGGKKIAAIATKIKDAELKLAVADLQMTIAELRSQAAELTEENTSLKSEISDLQKKADVRTKIKKGHNCYYFEEEITGYGRGPFCLKCMDADNKLSQVTVKMGGFKSMCHLCGSEYIGVSLPDRK